MFKANMHMTLSLIDCFQAAYTAERAGYAGRACSAF